MKRILKISVLIILLIGCKNYSQEREDQFDNSKISMHTVPESKISFILPKEYSKKSSIEYKEMILNSNINEESKINMIIELSKLENQFSNMEIFVDTITLINLVFLTKGPYIKLNKKNAELAVQAYTQIYSNPNLQGNDEKILETKLISRSQYKYVKVKVRTENHEGKKGILSHYLISTKNKTFGLSVLNTNGDDFQELINRIRIVN